MIVQEQVLWIIPGFESLKTRPIAAKHLSKVCLSTVSCSRLTAL